MVSRLAGGRARSPLVPVWGRGYGHVWPVSLLPVGEAGMVPSARTLRTETRSRLYL